MGSATQTYVTPTTSNQLGGITQTGATTRSFGYDASGNRATDTVGSTVLKAAYDGHGHLSGFQNGATTQGTYVYDGFARLVERIVANVGPAGTTQYLYDEFGHVVLETDGAGNSLREYIWLGDMPIGIIDQVNAVSPATPALYYVHADHLDRPIMVTNGAGASVWQATWSPFGAPQSITGTPSYNARFPGQWFQIENGLNWNRHYDPTTGRYLQPDPAGLSAMLADGPSRFGYARQSTLVYVDFEGLISADPENEEDYRHRKALGLTTDEEDVNHGSGLDPAKAPPGGGGPFGGGVYVLKDAITGGVMRSGRTGKLCVRQGQLARDPNFAPFSFVPVYKTDDYNEQRGLEQYLHDLYDPPLNKIRPISPNNPNLSKYIDSANDYLNRNPQ